MDLAVWAERSGVARVTAFRWFRAGLLPVPASRLILVDAPTADASVDRRRAVCARVSSADQKADLDWRVAWVTAWATSRAIPVDQVVTEVGSEYIQAALAAQGRELVVVDTAEVDDDLVRDMTDILTSMGTRLYRKRAAANRAKRAVAAAADDDCEAA
jgi:predicted site-specific integrase-resolvase